MTALQYSTFDMAGFWLGRLARAASFPIMEGAPGFSLIRRARPGEHMVDLLESGNRSMAILNASLYDTFLASAGDRPDKEALLAWLDVTTGATLETDNLFFADPSRLAAPATPPGITVRPLDEADGAAFAALDKACTKEDLEAGFVELDHDIVVGVFEGPTLVAKASSFAWWPDDDDDSPVWDIGYVTHPKHRGKGYGKLAAAFLAQELFAIDAIPMIRATDNRPASLGIARSLHFSFFGRWSYPESAD